MSIAWRFLTLVCITWCLVAQLYVVAVPLAVWYLFKVDGHELIMVSILVDGYYQAFYGVPILSLTTIGLIIFFDFIKPQLLMYTGGNEMAS